MASHQANSMRKSLRRFLSDITYTNELGQDQNICNHLGLGLGWLWHGGQCLTLSWAVLRIISVYQGDEQGI